jgi:hypothetical protein
MDSIIHSKKPSDSHWLLFPLLLFAALLVVVLSTLSVMALIGMIPVPQPDAAQPAAPRSEVQSKSSRLPANTPHPAGTAAIAYDSCWGTISVDATVFPGSNNGAAAVPARSQKFPFGDVHGQAT